MQMPKDGLVLVRHGQTGYNQQDRLTTRTDLPLTDIGREQAIALRPVLAEHRFASVWASSQQRAHHTALLALEGHADGASLCVDDRLVEADAGPFEGAGFTDLWSGAHPLSAQWLAYCDPVDPLYPDGAESLDDVEKRTRQISDQIQELGGLHVIFSHGTTLRVLLCSLLGLPLPAFRAFKLDNCSLSVVQFHPRPPHQAIFVNR